MKQLTMLLSLALLAIGCGSMQKQQKVNKMMEGYVFEMPAQKVYTAAEDEFKKMHTPLKSTGDFTGATEWVVRPVELGKKKYTEKSRFTVTVTKKDDKSSRLMVKREVKSDISGDWSEPNSQRYFVYEFNILKRLSPEKAKQIEAKAEATK